MLDYELISVCSLSSATMPLTRTRKATVQIAFHRPLSLSIRVQRVLSLSLSLSRLRTLFLPPLLSTGHHRFASCSHHQASCSFVPANVLLLTFSSAVLAPVTRYLFFVINHSRSFSRVPSPAWNFSRAKHTFASRACCARNIRWPDDRGSTITVKAGSRCVFVSQRSSRNRMIRFGRLP